MINQGARVRSMNVEKDYSIALEGQKAEREALNRAQDNLRKDQQEFDAFSQEINNQMSQFGKLDMHPNDVEAIRGVEKSARQKVAELLRKHGGDVRAFMRAGGGKGALNAYANTVKESPEYQTGILTAQTYKMADEAIKKNELPHMVNVGEPDAPNYIPFQEAVVLQQQKKLKGGLHWNGSFKPIQFADIAPLIRQIPNMSPDVREATPEEVRGMLMARDMPREYVEQMVKTYTNDMYGKGKGKNPLMVDGNADVRRSADMAANRNAELAKEIVKAEAKNSVVPRSPKAAALTEGGWTPISHVIQPAKVQGNKPIAVYEKKMQDAEEDGPILTGIPLGSRPDIALIRMDDGSMKAVQFGNSDGRHLEMFIGGDPKNNNVIFDQDNMSAEAGVLEGYTGNIIKMDYPADKYGKSFTQGAKNGEVGFAEAYVTIPDNALKKNSGVSGMVFKDTTKRRFTVLIPIAGGAEQRLKDEELLLKQKAQPLIPTD